MEADERWLMALDLSIPRGVLLLDGPPGTLRRDVDGASRASHLFVAAAELISEAGIDPGKIGLIGVARGPGSFTGVRVAVTAAKVLASVLDVPLVAPDSLMVTAMGAGEQGDAVFAAIDARREEIYHALYRRDRGYPEVLVEPRVAAPESAAAALRDWMEREGCGVAGVGDGIEAYPVIWPAAMTRAKGPSPRAEGLAALCRLAYGRGETVDPIALLPFYLRLPDARDRGGCGEE